MSLSATALPPYDTHFVDAVNGQPQASFRPDVGSESQPFQPGIGSVEISHEDWMRALNPLQHLPGVGMIYRLVTGETLPAPLRVAGAGIAGGPLGMLGAGVMGLLEKLIADGPDQSRPAAPAGFAATGSEAGVSPVSPGSLADGAYVMLATVTPDWLGAQPTRFAATGADAYRSAELEWRRSEAVEKGLA